MSLPRTRAPFRAPSSPVAKRRLVRLPGKPRSVRVKAPKVR